MKERNNNNHHHHSVRTKKKVCIPQITIMFQIAQVSGRSLQNTHIKEDPVYLRHEFALDFDEHIGSVVTFFIFLSSTLP